LFTLNNKWTLYGAGKHVEPTEAPRFSSCGKLLFASGVEEVETVINFLFRPDKDKKGSQERHHQKRPAGAALTEGSDDEATQEQMAVQLLIGPNYECSRLVLARYFLEA